LEKDPKQEWYESIRQAGVVATIPIMLGIGPVVGLYLGKGLDHLWSTSPIFSYVGLVLGFLAAIRETYRIIKQLSKKK